MAQVASINSVFEKERCKSRKKAPDPSKNPAVTGIAPRGYMMIDDFFAELEKEINDYCEKNNIS